MDRGACQSMGLQRVGHNLATKQQHVKFRGKRITDYQGQRAPEESKTDVGSSEPAPAEDESLF